MLGAGETEAQFEATCALVREVGFDRVNTAAYSPRPATPAAEWANQVPRVDFSAQLLRVQWQGVRPPRSSRHSVLLSRQTWPRTVAMLSPRGSQQRAI